MNIKNNRNEAGFTYIDVMIAVTILLVGVLALAAAVTAAVVRSREAEQRLIAKQLGDSALESIFSARDIDDLGWDAIGNVGSNPVNGVNKGVFLAGEQQIYSSNGADGIIGTADDATAQGATAMSGFTRTITITDLCDPERPSANCVKCPAVNKPADCADPGTYPVMMRQIDITITYKITNLTRTEAVSTVITNYQ
jgi:Tfp pilus assembly protein PilV